MIPELIEALKKLSAAASDLSALASVWEKENNTDSFKEWGEGAFSKENPYLVAKNQVEDAIWNLNDHAGNIASDGGWKDTSWVEALVA